MNCISCNYKLEQSFNYCPNCGLNLKSGKMVLSKARNENVDSKLLSQKTIYSLVGGGLILSFLILYLSGVLSGPSFNNIPKEGINQSGGQSPSVNLNNLEMINDLESKVKADPSDHQSLIELAHLRMDSGFFEQAIQNYKEYLKHHPEVADVIVDMAVCYFNLSEYDTALHYMKEALKIEPRHQIAHLNIGVVNLNMGNVAESKEWFKKAVELNPNTDAGKKAQQLLISH